MPAAGASNMQAAVLYDCAAITQPVAHVAADMAPAMPASPSDVRADAASMRHDDMHQDERAMANHCKARDVDGSDIAEALAGEPQPPPSGAHAPAPLQLPDGRKPTSRSGK
jgi:hypothetical protein